jgi:hypothetical protein
MPHVKHMPGTTAPAAIGHDAEEAAFRGIVVGDHMADCNLKLGGEGWMKHYDLCRQIVVDSFERFPMDYDWEAHMDRGGECWDVEIGVFALNWVDQNLADNERRPRNSPS